MRSGVRVTSPRLVLRSSSTDGLGWFATGDTSGSSGGTTGALTPGSLVLSVPAALALTVECPGAGPADNAVAGRLRPRQSPPIQWPWYVQMAVYLHHVDTTTSTSRVGTDGAVTDRRPWLDSLPRSFDTPLHWHALDNLQYEYMTVAVQRQRKQWRRFYHALTTTSGSGGSSSNSDGSGRAGMTWDDFVWGCECARSRAFSGSYTGSAFNPRLSAFTLLLVTAYVGLGLGSLEQAANGAGVVFAVTVLKGASHSSGAVENRKKHGLLPNAVFLRN